MLSLFYGITIWDANSLRSGKPQSKSFRMPWPHLTPVGAHFYLGLTESVPGTKDLSIFCKVQAHMHGWTVESDPPGLQRYYMALGVDEDDRYYSSLTSSSICNSPFSWHAAAMWEFLARNGWEEMRGSGPW